MAHTSRKRGSGPRSTDSKLSFGSLPRAEGLSTTSRIARVARHQAARAFYVGVRRSARTITLAREARVRDQSTSTSARVRLDRADNRVHMRAAQDFVGQFTSKDLNVPWKTERQAHPFAFHRRHAHDAERIARIADHDLFPFFA